MKIDKIKVTYRDGSSTEFEMDDVYLLSRLMEESITAVVTKLNNFYDGIPGFS